MNRMGGEVAVIAGGANGTCLAAPWGFVAEGVRLVSVDPHEAAPRTAEERLEPAASIERASTSGQGRGQAAYCAP